MDTMLHTGVIATYCTSLSGWCTRPSALQTCHRGLTYAAACCVICNNGCQLAPTTILSTRVMGTRNICSLVSHNDAGSCRLHLTGITEDHFEQWNQQMVLQMLKPSVAIVDLHVRLGQSGCSRSASLTWYASEAAVAAASSLALRTRGPSRCMTTALAMAPMTDLQLAPTRRFDTSVRTKNFVSCSLQCKERF